MAARRCTWHFLASIGSLSLLATLCWPSTLIAAAAQAAAAGTPKATITDVQFVELRELPPSQDSVMRKVSFRLTILGEHMVSCQVAQQTQPEVDLTPQDPGQPVEDFKIVGQPSAQQITVAGEARIGTVITSVTVTDRCPPPAPPPPGDAGQTGGKDTAQTGNVTITTEGGVNILIAAPSADTADAGDAGAGAGTGADTTPPAALDQCQKESVQKPDGKSNGKAAGNSATSKGLTISIKAIPPTSALRQFTMTFEHQQSKEFANLHSILLTKQTGEAGVGFDANPNRMRIDLEPTGATDLTVLQPSEAQLELHFVAADGYVPTNVVVTVYDSSDLDCRKAIAVGKVAAAAGQTTVTASAGASTAAADGGTASTKTKGSGASKAGASAAPAKNGNAPAIASVETVFLDRHEGNGRIRVYGQGFGNEPAPPFAVDAFLCDCLERSPQVLNEPRRPRTCGNFASRFNRGGQPMTEAELDLQEATRQDYCGVDNQGNLIKGGRMASWLTWRCGVSATANVYGRNPGIRVERAEIIDINGEMVDIYFEFTRHRHYAWPFRLAGVDLTVPTSTKKVEQVVNLPSAQAMGEVDSTSASTTHLSSAIGPPPDENLTYRYTVLSDQEVGHLLGEGVANNFHVVELAVVNDGAKKVAVPLAGMQAEVEWLYGPASSPKQTDTRPGAATPQQTRDTYMEGPPTLPPVPMPVVSAYFGASKKSTEHRVKVFNALEGVTTFVGALIPFAGVGLKDAEVVFSSGFIPGLRHAWPDITDQQLQNLTTLSWQTSETLAAGGGTAEKLIYIQKGKSFQDEDEPISEPPSTTRQQLSNIMGMEVVGYEITDSPAKQATPASKSPATGTDSKTSSTTTKTAPSGSTKTMTTTTATTPPPSNP